ncbi:hypothetical protein L6Q96_02745 [Candidatus Binatia bacterium]|nr:hypothetical protein [Candidatus Binatia bacterium]
MSDSARLTWALALSLLLHGLLVAGLPSLWRPSLDVSVPPLIEVDMFQPPAPAPAPAPAARPAPPPAAAAPAPPPITLPERQIVSPSEHGEERVPEKTRLLSDRDVTVPEETVKRGDPAPGDPDAKSRPVVAQEPKKAAPPAAAPRRNLPPRAPAARAERAPRAAERAALPGLEQLLPQPGDFARHAPREPVPRAVDPPAEQHAAIPRDDLLRYGDPWRRGGLSGATLDFLPAIREGDITMLNTKAEQFAPFVRRVAVRVFENFRINLRRSVDAGRFDSSQEYASIEAVMDRQGQLVSIEVRERSTSGGLGTDRNLQAAVREGFFDRNPPSGAEAVDGQIHFVFDAQVALSLEPGRGLVGYRAVFRAGLL